MYQSKAYNLAKPQAGTQKWLQPLQLEQWVRLELRLLEASTGMIYMAW